VDGPEELPEVDVPSFWLPSPPHTAVKSVPAGQDVRQVQLHAHADALGELEGVTGVRDWLGWEEAEGSEEGRGSGLASGDAIGVSLGDSRGVSLGEGVGVGVGDASSATRIAWNRMSLEVAAMLCTSTARTLVPASRPVAGSV
jgi:hypothetical protein